MYTNIKKAFITLCCLLGPCTTNYAATISAKSAARDVRSHVAPNVACNRLRHFMNHLDVDEPNITSNVSGYHPKDVRPCGSLCSADFAQQAKNPLQASVRAAPECHPKTCKYKPNTFKSRVKNALLQVRGSYEKQIKVLREKTTATKLGRDYASTMKRSIGIYQSRIATLDDILNNLNKN